ncbi:MAG: geranylgeranyl reductase family protein [Candidatus Bipolaricaulaceae bacterium]
MKFEVVVVGGGPAGALAARAAAKARAKTLLLERSPKRIPCCAGLVSPRTADRLGIPSHVVLREIRAVRVFSPQGRVVELRADEVKGLVLDRPRLDWWLREKAQESGVEIWTAEARGLEGGKLCTTKGLVDFEALVGADGVYSVVAREAGLPRPREVLVAVQAEVRAELKDTVEVHFGVAPDFFAWAVPGKEGIVKVGLATSFGRQAMPKLWDFLAKRFRGQEILGVRAGLIPVGPPERVASDRVVLTGNAAGQVKPLTGGGLAFLSRCAPLAGKAAAFGGNALQEYEEAWRKAVGEELAFQERARWLFLRLPSEALEELVQILANPKLAEVFSDFGDIDNFSALSAKILRRPGLWTTILPLARWLSQWEAP